MSSERYLLLKHEAIVLKAAISALPRCFAIAHHGCTQCPQSRMLGHYQSSEERKEGLFRFFTSSMLLVDSIKNNQSKITN